jgi:hypothetical protein
MNRFLYNTCRARKRNTTGKGGRWVVSDAGDIDGPLPEQALLMYKSKNTGDYHGEFDGPQ